MSARTTTASPANCIASPTLAPRSSAWKTTHSLTNPLSGGSPTIAAEPIRNVAVVTGIERASPPRRAISLVPVAGAGIHATGTREIDRLGGLARSMPVTTATFLIGSAAIVGLPPLNGFVSEWVVFQALLRGASAGDALRFAGLAVVVLAFIGALALACFVKVIGVV